MPVALAYPIGGHWHICILLLFVIGFNPYNVYALLYGAPEYGENSICTYLGRGLRTDHHIHVPFCYELILYPVLFMCEFYDLFSSWSFFGYFVY